MAVKVLSSVAQNSTSDSAKVAAATELLNRGWGRAQPATGDGEQVTVVIRRILEGTVAEVAPATNGRLPALDGEVLSPEE